VSAYLHHASFLRCNSTDASGRLWRRSFLLPGSRNKKGMVEERVGPAAAPSRRGQKPGASAGGRTGNACRSKRPEPLIQLRKLPEASRDKELRGKTNQYYLGEDEQRKGKLVACPVSPLSFNTSISRNWEGKKIPREGEKKCSPQQAYPE